MKNLPKKMAVILSIILALQIFQPLSLKVQAKTLLNAPSAGSFNAVIKNSIAYVTCGITGFYVIDMQDPANPRKIAFIHLPEVVLQIGIYDNFIYLPAGNNLYIVDVTDPVYPVVTYRPPLNSNGRLLVGIAIDTGRMYAAYEENIEIFSLDHPYTPVPLKIFPLKGIRITGLEVRSGTAYIADGHNGIWIYDLSDLNNIIYKGNYSGHLDDYTDNEYSGLIQDIKSIIYLDREWFCVPDTQTGTETTPALDKEPPNKDSDKTAYITIDDGPSRNITAMNLDTLKKYNIKATFFVLPKSGMDAIYKRIIDEGHEIGNHSFSHNYSYLYGSAEDFRKDVLKAKKFIFNKFKYTSKVFRFPGGAMGKDKNMIKERADILEEIGYRYFDWNASTGDTAPDLKKYGDEEHIVNLLADNVIKDIKNRKKVIILMHDTSSKIYSAKALPVIIKELIEQGYRFDVLSNY